MDLYRPMNLIVFNRKLIFNKNVGVRIHFDFYAEKNIWQEKLRWKLSPKIWIKAILSLLKVRGVIAENIMLLKYEKQAITALLNEKNNLMLLTTALEKSWIYQVLLFVVSRNTLATRNKFPDWEIYWSVDLEFYSRLGIWYCKSNPNVN